MKILVTGAAGFIGSSLTESLLERGDEVIGIDNFHDYYSPERKRANIKPLKDNSKFTFIEGDFTDADTVTKLFSEHQPERVSHIGAMANVRYSVRHPLLFVQTNVHGTALLLDAAVKHGAKHFVFASTSSVYGQRENVPFFETDSTDLPLAPYPATKKSGELLGHAYFNMHGLTFTALRFFNVYGPKGRPDMMPYIVIDNLVNDREITLFDAGKPKRDWTFIEDILSGVIAAIDNPFGFEVFNLGRGEPVQMTEFMEIMQRLVDKDARIVNTPKPASDPDITYANVDKARDMLNYNPSVSLADGLQKFWEWYQKEVLN